MKAILVFLTCCSLAVGVAGCGGSKGVSKDEYRSDLAKISKEVTRSHQALAQGASKAKSVAQVETLLRTYAAAEDRIGDEVAKLKVPDDAKAANAELAKGQHDDADELRAILPKLARFKSVQRVFGYLQGIGNTKGGRETEAAVGKLKQLGYTKGS